MAGLTEAKGSSLILDDDLASTAAGKGASLIGVQAAGTDLETYLAILAAGTGSSLLTSVTPKTTNYTIVAGDNGTFMPVTGTSLITLLAAATAGVGFTLLVQNAGVATVTVDGNAAETINGAATVALAAGGWILLVCDGTNWVGAQHTASASSADISNLVSKPIDRLVQYNGDGSDGAFSSIGASTLSDFLYNYTTFALNSGHTITIDTPVCIIRATTSIVIDGDINARGVDIAGGAGALMGSLGDSLGSSGGGGGQGGLGYNSGGADNIGELGDKGEDGGNTYFAAGGVGGFNTSLFSTGASGTVGASPATNQKALISSLFTHLIARGGGKGGDGGRGGDGSGADIIVGAAGGIGGLSGVLLILIAPSITINAATIDLTGQAGTNGTNANLTTSGYGGGGGGGGGGAGGSLVKVSPSITDVGTTTVTGGAAGSGGSLSFGLAGGDGGAGADGYTYEIDPS